MSGPWQVHTELQLLSCGRCCATQFRGLDCSLQPGRQAPNRWMRIRAAAGSNDSPRCPSLSTKKQGACFIYPHKLSERGFLLSPLPTNAVWANSSTHASNPLVCVFVRACGRSLLQPHVAPRTFLTEILSSRPNATRFFASSNKMDVTYIFHKMTQ